MSKLRFPLNSGELTAVILCTVIGAFVVGFFCYLSLNFLSLGKTLPSIIWAVVIALFLCIPIIVAVILKKTSRPTKGRIIWEWVLLFIFAVVAILTILPFSHYFVVSEQKATIQQNVNDCISQSEAMFDNYQIYAENRINTYEQELKLAISKGHNGQYIYPSKYYQFQFQAGGDDNQQLEDKLTDLRYGLFEYPFNFQKEKENYLNQITEYKEILGNWYPISVVAVVSNVSDYLTQRHNDLNKMSQFRPKGKDGNVIENAKDFAEVSPQTLCADNVKGYFKGILGNKATTNTTALCLAIGLYVLILLPYIAIRRHSKFHGYKTLFKSHKATNVNNSNSGGTISFD
jgi:hypothetical protein